MQSLAYAPVDEHARLHIGLKGRMKHGDLLRAMEQRGWNQSQLGEFLGMTPSVVGRLLNLKWIPKRFSDDIQIKLLELTGKLPDELWPAWSRDKAFLSATKKFVLTKEVSPSDLAESGLYALEDAPDVAFSRRELSEQIEAALKTLKPREAKVIKMRFGLDPSVDEDDLESVRAAMNVSRGRIYQIEQNALRKLRHPSRSKRLAPFVDRGRPSDDVEPSQSAPFRGRDSVDLQEQVPHIGQDADAKRVMRLLVARCEPAWRLPRKSFDVEREVDVFNFITDRSIGTAIFHPTDQSGLVWADLSLQRQALSRGTYYPAVMFSGVHRDMGGVITRGDVVRLYLSNYRNQDEQVGFFILA